MFTSISPSAVRVLTCPYDAEPRTKFTVLVSLPFDIRAEIKDKFSRYSREAESKKVEYEYAFGARSIEIVRHGLKAIEGGPDCEIITEGTRLVVAPKTLQALSIAINKDGHDTLIDWLATEIWKGTEPTEEEKQVFRSQSAP